MSETQASSKHVLITSGKSKEIFNFYLHLSFSSSPCEAGAIVSLYTLFQDSTADAAMMWLAPVMGWTHILHIKAILLLFKSCGFEGGGEVEGRKPELATREYTNSYKSPSQNLDLVTQSCEANRCVVMTMPEFP